MNEFACRIRCTSRRRRAGSSGKYIFSLDHKVIGMQYYPPGTCRGDHWESFCRCSCAFIWSGQTAHLPIRRRNMTRRSNILRLVTMHGTMMVFFVLTTAPQSGFGNYFLPIQIGAPDMAFPTLNMLSFWTTFLAFCRPARGVFRAGRRRRSAAGRPMRRSADWAKSPDQARASGRRCGWSASRSSASASLMCALNFLATTIDLRSGHVADAHAPHRVGLVHYRDPRLAGVRRATGGRHIAAAGSLGGNELFHSRRLKS